MNVLKELWKNKPMFITVAIGAAVLLYILYKNNSATVVAPAAADVAPPASLGVSGGTYVEESYYNNVQTTNNYPSTPVAPPPNTAPPGNTFPLPVILPPPIKTPAPTPTTKPIYQGLIGGGVRMFPQADGTMKYRGPKTGGKIIPVPLPKGTVYGPGGNGRYYYRLPGSSVTELLTIGNG